MSDTKQPEALRLAECLEQPDYCTLAQMRRAAAQLRTQHALLERARDALNGVNNIVRDSRGVAGYHLNGDTAEWDDFDEVDAAEQALAAITQHLEPKP